MRLEALFALLLRHPGKVLVGLLLITAVLGSYLREFRLDASADSLVVEGDPDLEFSRTVNARYGASDYLFVTFTPPMGTLFTPAILGRLESLRDRLGGLERVASVDSILDAPLFRVAGATLSNVADNIVTLSTPGRTVDLAAAQADLVSNMAYRDVLLSADGSTTALVVNMRADAVSQQLLARRTELRDSRRAGTLDDAGRAELAQVELDYTARNTLATRNLHEDIAAVRAILDDYRSDADIAMGGVPMIADDLITFVRSDLQNFSVAIVVFIIAALAFLFRRVRYVVIPMICGAAVLLFMMGLLGFVAWPVTVISSNFISLLLIITVSLNIHLIVRYRELEEEAPELGHRERLHAVLASMFEPCLYTSLTTLVAFGSLVVSNIPPIIDFGWMMVIGVFVTLLFSFLLFPALLALMRPLPLYRAVHGLDLTPWLARFTERFGFGVLLVSGLLTLASIAGIQRLRVENSFIEYFDESTDIYRGMVAIDTQMGGTTPLDVVVNLTRPNRFSDAAASNFGEQDEFADEDADAETGDPDAYWFTSDKMDRISAMHAWLDALPETGKVLSLATLLDLAYELNGGRKLSSPELGVLYNSIPQEYKETLLRPYVSVADNQVRYSLRIRETDPDLVRTKLLQTIREGLEGQFGLDRSQVQLTGMLVLYNNMLQSLYTSQILSLSLVMALIFVMFVVLFRSWRLAVVGIVPNLIAVLAVLGLMGWLDIPLDMMTIMIASISVGIGVDNTIHYMHRFQHHFPRLRNYHDTMHYCHGSIGKGIYYTSFTIIVGFSILVMSNFVPTVYFGLLTSLAMLLALGGSLTLLPRLLVVLKPMGPEQP